MSTSNTSRTFYCGETREDHVGQSVRLYGWVQNWRDHGGLIFIDLRDREGIVQIVFDPEHLPAERFEAAHRLRSEDVLSILGKVRERPADTANPKLPTGNVEVLLDEFELLAHAEPLPFKPDDRATASEDLRLRYRYLDLRRPAMYESMKMRAGLFRSVRSYLDSEGLLEIETPILTKSTPEGARDFLVPSRTNQGTFYALPQSPQLFKQILMVGGLDRYYQIARCFRDEDLRANRQPEFTQIDIELSFVTPEDIYALGEGMMSAIYRDLKDIELETPFPRMPYAEAMLRFGSDKPDLRFDLEIKEVTEAFRVGCEFKVFNTILEKGGVARALCVPGGADKFSNTQLKIGGELPEYVARYGAKGLAWFRAEAADGGKTVLTSNITKFFKPECLDKLVETSGATPGDLVLIICDQPKKAANALGHLRLYLGQQLELIDKEALALCWITDFPQFDWDEDAKRWDVLHHPFTAPNPEDIDRLESDPGSVRSLGYDLTLNGEEVGGGSIRIHQKEVQEKVFRILKISPENAAAKFGFLLDALSFGAPPHGGIAFGLDRLMMILQDRDSIRDVIAFPKTQSAACPMTEAPSPVDGAQLKDLGIRLDPLVEEKLREAELKRQEQLATSAKGTDEDAAE